MVSRIRPIVLCTKTVIHGTLDDSEVWTYQHVIAHVTEVNGAQVQNNLFGKQFKMTWVARIQGQYQADSVAFPKKDVADENLNKYKVVQVRKHATRTDFFFSDDLEVDSNELEQ
ncbi:MAG TPA: hypothetical protein K8W06_04480 [Limosilactobacillus coleohominis]|nr:hypothetical protein [Limosilactobacillus coleohominis]